MWRDLERICELLAIPFTRPSKFPRNGLLAARIACFGENEQWLPDFVQSVFRANFADDLDIEKAEVAASLLAQLSLPQEVLAESGSERIKLKLRKNTEEAIDIGVFGAPVLAVGEELFWGNDRIESAISFALEP